MIVPALVKLVIWDLDDTLWRGTLADGDNVPLFADRARLIRDLNDRGVVNSICSKNDHASAEAQLRQLGLWDAFVFPHIAFTPKPEAIRQIIADMQLRAANVLFIDDKIHTLEGARAALPEIQILDATAPDADRVLARILALQPVGASSRLAKYRQLEARARDRAAIGGSDEAFLRGCAIQACAPFLMDNLDFAPRIAELINRSNQLNYTASRVDETELAAAIIDVVRYDSWSIFAWDKYCDHGLVGFAMVDRQNRRLMFDCQSGGIAHFSRHRAKMDFDNAPRLFALRHLIPECLEREGLTTPQFAPFLVYGAGVDYSDPRWPDMVEFIADGRLFAHCVQLLCQRISAEQRRMMVILPPEDAPDTQYRPQLGHTRARTALFNAIWRRAVIAHAGIDIFELTGFASPNDMPDVSHYYAGFLGRLAGVVDGWIEQEIATDRHLENLPIS